MKRSACLFVYAWVASVYFGSALGDETGDGNVTDCQLHSSRRGHLQIVEELIKIQARCLNESNNSDITRLQTLNGLEEHRAFFKHLCIGRLTTRQCLAEEYTKWTSCYNETLGKLFTIVDELVGSSFEKGCVNDGENLAVITEGYHRFTEDYRARNPFVRECIIYNTARWSVVLRSEASIATKIWFFYRTFRNFKQCFAEHIPEDSLVSVSVQHVDELLEEMKCIHPVDENLVLCKSIDSSLIDRASACPLRLKDKDAAPISMVLERRLSSCFIVHEPYSQRLSNASTLEEFASYFKNYCRRSYRVRGCLSETTIAAEVCLHDVQYKNFKLVHDYMNNTLEAGCLEDGRRMANIFYTVKNVQNNAGEQNGLISCVTAAVQMSPTTFIEDPSRMYQIYQELPVTRQCIVDKTTGDSAYYDDVNGITNDVMAKMKCVDPRDGNIVLCKTIVSS